MAHEHGKGSVNLKAGADKEKGESDGSATAPPSAGGRPLQFSQNWTKDSGVQQTKGTR